jgi:7-carboxy-7-deazaguanine synthase
MAAPSALYVNEIFDSVQGEGVSAGMHCAFLRLVGCNLSCTWCDTKYTWDWKHHVRSQETRRMEIADLAQRLQAAPALVITGGEPLLQQSGIEALLRLLPVGLHIEVETNGTLPPRSALLRRVNQWNISPKLSGAGGDQERRILLSVLQMLATEQNAYLKLVVSSELEFAEAQALVARLAWPASRVLLQAEASTRNALRRAAPRVQQWCHTLGVRYSPRLHVERWNDRRGV